MICVEYFLGSKKLCGNLKCFMIDSMGESRWLDVEARERLELDLMKSVTIRDWRSNHVAEENDNNSALSWQFFLACINYLLRPGNSRLPRVGVA